MSFLRSHEPPRTFRLAPFQTALLALGASVALAASDQVTNLKIAGSEVEVGFDAPVSDTLRNRPRSPSPPGSAAQRVHRIKRDPSAECGGPAREQRIWCLPLRTRNTANILAGPGRSIVAFSSRSSRVRRSGNCSIYSLQVTTSPQRLLTQRALKLT